MRSTYPPEDVREAVQGLDFDQLKGPQLSNGQSETATLTEDDIEVKVEGGVTVVDPDCDNLIILTNFKSQLHDALLAQLDEAGEYTPDTDDGDLPVNIVQNGKRFTIVSTSGPKKRRAHQY